MAEPRLFAESNSQLETLSLGRPQDSGGPASPPSPLINNTTSRLSSTSVAPVRLSHNSDSLCLLFEQQEKLGRMDQHRFLGERGDDDDPVVHVLEAAMEENKTAKRLLDETGLFSPNSFHIQGAPNLFHMDTTLQRQFDHLHSFAIVPSTSHLLVLSRALFMTDEENLRRVKEKRLAPSGRPVNSYIDRAAQALGVSSDELRYDVIVLRPDRCGFLRGRSGPRYLHLGVEDPSSSTGERVCRRYTIQPDGDLRDQEGALFPPFVHETSRQAHLQLKPFAFVLNAVNKVWRFEQNNGPDFWQCFSPRVQQLVALLNHLVLQMFQNPVKLKLRNPMEAFDMGSFSPLPSASPADTAATPCDPTATLNRSFTLPPEPDRLLASSRKAAIAELSSWQAHSMERSDDGSDECTAGEEVVGCAAASELETSSQDARVELLCRLGGSIEPQYLKTILLSTLFAGCKPLPLRPSQPPPPFEHTKIGNNLDTVLERLTLRVNELQPLSADFDRLCSVITIGKELQAISEESAVAHELGLPGVEVWSAVQEVLGEGRALCVANGASVELEEVVGAALTPLLVNAPSSSNRTVDQVAKTNETSGEEDFSDPDHSLPHSATAGVSPCLDVAPSEQQ
ncbi:hypothetical protein JCM10207_000849 [Rhodosporidiobolus poonsookiae]